MKRIERSVTACLVLVVGAMLGIAACSDQNRPPSLESAPSAAGVRAERIAQRQQGAAGHQAYRLAATALSDGGTSERLVGRAGKRPFWLDFDQSGLGLRPDAGPWRFGLRAASYGCDGERRSLPPVLPRTVDDERNRVVYERGPLQEIFVNGPLGVEHVFRATESPCRDGARKLEIDLATHGLRPQADRDRRGAVLQDDRGQARLHYSDLFAEDARGRELPSSIETLESAIRLIVNVADAVFPISIDPLIWYPQDKLLASDGTTGDRFGWATAISGDAVLVGAYLDAPKGTDSGAAYFFRASGDGWDEQKIVAADGANGDQLGYSVSIDGDVAIVGARWDDDKGANAGAAYVFARVAGTWTEQQKLVASDGAAGDWFGYAVAASGTTLLVGAPADNATAGSAYVFTWTGSSWTEQQKLTPAVAANQDNFGAAVTLAGDTALVGAPEIVGARPGSAYIFTRSGSKWTEQPRLRASDGAADDRFGTAVTLSGGTAIIGAHWDDDAGSRSGSAYVFEQSEGGWSEQQKLTASDAVANDLFGFAVSLSGDRALVGAPNHNLSAGSVYAFVRVDDTWTQDPPIVASDGAAGDQFGYSVAISGDRAVVGAYVDANGTGAAYTFTLQGADGFPCLDPAECGSGFCVDGVCCDAACDGGCDACDGQARGWPGTIDGACARAPLAFTGEPSCGAYVCSGTSGACPSACSDDSVCPSDRFCAASGSCELRKSTGGTCDLIDDCAASGCRECVDGTSCKDGYCCSSECSGSCRTCSANPGTCTVVKSADDGDTCTGDYTCAASGACKLKNGQVCVGGASTCASSHCADGFCCNTACSGGCDLCSEVPGTCTLVPAGSDGESTSCAPYVCGGAATCPTTCESDAGCAAGFYCSPNGACIAQKPQGSSCADSTNGDCKVVGCRVCSTGIGKCVDGFCCDSTCSSTCDACDGGVRGWSNATNGTCAVAPEGFVGVPACGAYSCTGQSGTCSGTECSSDLGCGPSHYCDDTGHCQPRKSQGSACDATAGENCLVTGCRVCASGHCKDGYCCESACNGSCEKCSATPGSCESVVSADDAPECTGDNTCNVSGACTREVGQSCTLASQCVTGFCADGYCCDKACAGGCDRCDTTPGTCSAIGAGSSGQNPSCAPEACNGTSPNCPGGCNGDGDCSGTHYCSSSGECLPRKANGASCDLSLGSDCLVQGCRACVSNNCVSGYCCNTACSGACDACSAALGASANGTCGNVAAGSSGQPACSPYVCSGKAAACPTTCTTDAGCAGSHYCDLNGVCQLRKSQGEACDPRAGVDCKVASCRVCQTGNCSDGTCCDSACGGGCDVCQAALGGSDDGVCTFLEEGSVGTTCGDYLCDGTSGACPKAGSCVEDEDCAGDAYCSLPGGVCESRKALGETCTLSSECAPVDSNVVGYCIDGRCCNNACSNGCSACRAALKESGIDDGECGPARRGTDPHEHCNEDPTESCGQTGFCNDVGGCQLWPRATSCGPTFCTQNNITGKICSGTGSCINAEGIPCSPYLCQGDKCTIPCGSSAQCEPNYYCVNGTCARRESDGRACTAGEQCESGFCVDGVCCDSPCNEQCAACSLSGSLGVCSPVTGAPVAPRVPCVGEGACQGSCDGGDITGCQFPGQGQVCAEASCVGDSVRPAARCDEDECVPASTESCVPYSCDVEAKACRTSCAGDQDCAAGARCETSRGLCTQEGNRCADSFTVETPSREQTSCAPYKCQSGSCQQQCTSSSDCADVYVCIDSACVLPPMGGAGPGGEGPGVVAGAPPVAASSSSDDEGGCGCRAAGADSGRTQYWCLLGVALVLARRRRRTASYPTPSPPPARGCG